MSEEQEIVSTNDRPAEVDGGGSDGTVRSDPWKNYISAAQRAHKKTMEKLEALEERLNGLSQTSNGPSATPDNTGYAAQTDYSQYSSGLTPQEVEAIVERKTTEVVGREKTQRELADSIKYVESLDFLKDSDEAQEELYEIMNEHEMDWKKKPLSSVRAAVSIFKERHGLSKNTDSAGQQAAGTQGSVKSPAASGGKVYKVSELAKKPPLELQQLMPELIEAKKQGRWIND